MNISHVVRLHKPMPTEDSTYGVSLHFQVTAPTLSNAGTSFCAPPISDGLVVLFIHLSSLAFSRDLTDDPRLKKTPSKVLKQ